MDFRREADPTSQIAQERVQPGRPGMLFLGLAGLLVAGVLAAGLWLGRTPLTVTLGEQADPSLVSLLGLSGGRVLSAACAAAAVGAVACTGRRLLHSDGWGLLAGALLALDPAFLAMARLALPQTVAMMGLLVGLACFVSGSPRLNWAGSAALWLAALADPRSLLWSLPLAALLLVRGHIYAAPRHLGLATAQAFAIPLTAAVLHLVVSGGVLPASCLTFGRISALGLTLVADQGSGIAAVHNPATWFGGLGALLFLALAAGSVLVQQFRVARLPGRVQLRIAEGMPPILARGLWILLLALFAPSPVMWLPMFALALAAGMEALAYDAPGFGASVGAVLLVFAGLALVRGWTFVQGGSDLAPGSLAGLVPWGHALQCYP